MLGHLLRIRPFHPEAFGLPSQQAPFEESHGYAGHTIRTVGSMVNSMRNSGLRDFLDEPRFARMIAFFLSVLSPRDAEFGNRVVPPIGDHGGPPVKD